MNYLTNYYKNLCEQLQDQVNNLSNKLNMLNEMEGEGSTETGTPVAGNQAAPSAGTVTTSDPDPGIPVKPVRQKGESQEQWQRALDRYAEQVRARNEWLARQRQTPRKPTVPPKPANTPQPVRPGDLFNPKPVPKPIPNPLPRKPRPQPFNPNDVGPPAPVGPEVPETTPQVYPFPVPMINPFENKLMKNKGYR